MKWKMLASLVLAFALGVGVGHIVMPKTMYTQDTIGVFCTLYGDGSMCCNPVDTTGGSLWIFRTPGMFDAKSNVFCNYSLSESKFLNCSYVNTTKTK